MSLSLIVLLAPLVLIGHGALWISFWNNVQGTAMPQWLNDTLSHIAKAACGLLPFVIPALLLTSTAHQVTLVAIDGYILVCLLITTIAIPYAWVRRLQRNTVTHLRTSQKQIKVNLQAKRESIAKAGFLGRVVLGASWNQSFELEVNEKEIDIARLPDQLDGLSIAHISDLHFTGHIAKRFFDDAIDLVNEMDADMVAITGDLVDKRPYLAWLPTTLGRLRARHGVHVILGNHDCKHDLYNMRLMLSEIGLSVMGGRMIQFDCQGKRIILAGNELPWIAPAAEMADCPTREEVEQLRILLAHTPDALPWARHYDFDFMMAGHTHGGQFCLPSYGPVACPTRLPLEYASGMIYEPPTVLHVSRGMSGELPLRINCRPEITRLVLRVPAKLGKPRTLTTTAELSEVYQPDA